MTDDDLLDGDALVDRILGRTPRPVDWSRLDGDEARAAHDALQLWVHWLVRRYAFDHRDVPPCWAEHDALVEELSALHTAHRACFDHAGSPMGPAEWHQILGSTRARLQVWASRTGCRTGEHRADPVPPWITPTP
ncbi:hypothetical protein [uncultured Cellulomonas sp.]|uniref:hypothetical protein n=1 Tax=uncultured Cellulomonas sp. TaxID=189682 RepID=UPI0028EF6041|nr:hypothetical protein [uncultured Cellulomonas sp.]